MIGRICIVLVAVVMVLILGVCLILSAIARVLRGDA